MKQDNQRRADASVRGPQLVCSNGRSVQPARSENAAPRGDWTTRKPINSSEWSELTFGRYRGLTLPVVVLLDPDWFFWALERGGFRGRFGREAEEVAVRARAIKVPQDRPPKHVFDHEYDSDGRFLGFVIVSENSFKGRYAIRLPYLDLSQVRALRTYDKRGCRRLHRALCRYFFPGQKLTKRRCEEFFNDDDNFALGRNW